MYHTKEKRKLMCCPSAEFKNKLCRQENIESSFKSLPKHTLVHSVTNYISKKKKKKKKKATNLLKTKSTRAFLGFDLDQLYGQHNIFSGLKDAACNHTWLQKSGTSLTKSGGGGSCSGNTKFSLFHQDLFNKSIKGTANHFVLLLVRVLW